MLLLTENRGRDETGHLCCVIDVNSYNSSSSYHSSPIHPSLSPFCLTSVHFTFYLPPLSFSLCIPTPFFFLPPPTFSLCPPRECTHCSVSNGSAPPQRIHQAEARRATAFQLLALSRQTACQSYR